MLRRILLSCAALVAATGFAYGADLPLESPAPAFAAPIFTWTGFYLGLNGGYGWGASDFVLVQCGCMNGQPDPAMIPFYGKHIASTAPKGGIFGGQIGYNYQFGSIVLGVEGSLDWSGVSGSYAWTMNGEPHTMSTNLQWFGTVGPRLGYAFDRALLYVTGGAAWGGYKYGHTHNMINNVPPTVMSLSGTNTNAGWMIGGGVEYAVTGNITVKAEYNYIDFGSHNQTVRQAGGPNFIVVNVKDSMNLLKVGLNYKF